MCNAMDLSFYMDNKQRITLPIFFLMLILTLIIPLLFSQIVIRYIYTDWLEPESTAGSVMLAESVVTHQLDPFKKNILILGNSRIGEGFSAKLANANVKNQEYNFVALAMPGTTPRIWSYVLRKIDSKRNKFYAIYVMAENYNDTAEENYNERDLDSAYLSGIFRLEDLLTYPSSFESPKKINGAIKNILLPVTLLQKDIGKFLTHPLKRIKNVKLWRRDFFLWIVDYGGKEEQLPPLDNIESFTSVLDLVDSSKKSGMEWYFKSVQYCNKTYVYSFHYNSHWFGEIGQQYANRAVHLGAFMIPRGPYHNMMGCDVSLKGSLAILNSKGLLELIPNQFSSELEKPEYFFDHLHMNSAGRREFSAKLAVAIVNQLEN
jgi:hypothetical protein